MSYYQGRMMYPSYVGGRRHPRAGRPHPFLYANAGNRRTFPHRYFGTQPTGYGIRGGDPRYSGIAGSAGQVYQHMLAGAYRPPVAQASWVSVRTPWGRRANYEGLSLARDYRSETAAKRREFKRGQRDLRNQIRDLRRGGAQAQGTPFGGLAAVGANKQIARLQAQLKAQAASYRSGFKQRRDDYKSRRRSIATQRPMYARVRRHPWYGYSNWGPTRSWLRRRRRYG